MTNARPEQVGTGAVMNVPGGHDHDSAPHRQDRPGLLPPVLPWAQQVIERAGKPVPEYGSAAWAALPDQSWAKAAACVIAAEAWRTYNDPAEIALRLRLELDAHSAEQDAPGMWTSDVVEQVRRTARRPSFAELCRRRSEPDRETRALEHERRMEGLMSHGE